MKKELDELKQIISRLREQNHKLIETICDLQVENNKLKNEAGENNSN